MSDQEAQSSHPLGAFGSSRDVELVLHVGHVKTASTWLQDTIFRDPASGFVVPWDNPGGRAVAAFMSVNSYCDDPASARALFEDGLRRCSGPEVPILSEENLCGNPIGRLYTGRYVADRIHAAFPSARIMIGVREQKALALSLYREYLNLDGTQSLDTFLGRGDEPFGFTPILSPEFLEYDRVVGYYQRLYGRSNVLVLPMEELQLHPQQYVRKILTFCGCRGRIEELSEARRVGSPAAVLALRRSLNPWIQASPVVPWPSTRTQRATLRAQALIDRVTPRAWSEPLERRWKTRVSQRYAGRFRESNRRLAELTGIGFSALGYE